MSINHDKQLQTALKTLYFRKQNKGGSHASKPAHDLEERRKFLLQIGLARHEAYDLAKGTNFSVNYYMEKRNKWLKNGLGEKNEIDNRLICEIKSGDYKCESNNSGNGAGHLDRSNRRANDRNQGRFNMRSNDEYDYDRMIETPPPQILSYQIEREHRQNYDQSSKSRSPSRGVLSDRNLDDFQSPRSRSPSRDFNVLQQEGGCDRSSVNLQYSQSSRPRSPSRGLESMQQERESDRNLDDFQSTRSLSSSRGCNSMLQEIGYNRNFDSLQYSQLCRPHSPSRGFNSMPNEVGSARNVDNFQSTPHSTSRQFNSIDEREYSRNINSSLKHMMGSELSSPTNYDSYMFNNNSGSDSNIPESQMILSTNRERAKRSKEGLKALAEYKAAIRVRHRLGSSPNLSTEERDRLRWAMDAVEKGRAHFNSRAKFAAKNPFFPNSVEEGVIESMQEKRQRSLDESPSANNPRNVDDFLFTSHSTSRQFNSIDERGDSRNINSSLKKGPELSSTTNYDSYMFNNNSGSDSNIAESQMSLSTKRERAKRCKEGLKALAEYKAAIRVQHRLGSSPNLSTEERDRLRWAVDAVEKGRAHFNNRAKFAAKNPLFPNSVEEGVIESMQEKRQRSLDESPSAHNLRNVDDFQSISHSTSRQFNSIDEREYSRNINSSLKNMMGSEPSSTTNYDSYMFNNNSESDSNIAESQMSLSTTRERAKRSKEGLKALAEYKAAIKVQHRLGSRPNLSTEERDRLRWAVDAVEKGRAHFNSRAKFAAKNPFFPNSVEEGVIESMQEKRQRSLDESPSANNPRNVDDFQSISHSTSRQFNSIDERGDSRNINSSLKKGPELSSTTNYDSYMFNNNSGSASNIAESQMSLSTNSYFGNQYLSSNVTPLVGKKSSSYRSNTNNQGMRNIKPLMGVDNPSQDKSRNTKNTAPLIEDNMKNKNVPSLLSGSDSNIPESQMSLSTNSYFGNQYPSSNVPPLARLNSSSYRSNINNQGMRNIKSLMGVDNPSQDNSRNTKNITPLIEYNVTNNNLPSLPLVQHPTPFSSAFWSKQPSNSVQLTLQEQRKLENKQKWKEQQKLSEKIKKEKKRERRQQRRLDPYKKPISNIPIIPSGFKKPSRGFSKANPEEYWTQWWPRYKYLEMSIPKVNPQDEVVRKAINFLLKPQDPAFRTRKNLLLRLGVNKIKRNVNLTEKNYSYRDTFKLFKYKKHLEDPNFQNELAPSELNNVKSTLALLNKRMWALLLQSLICKWHHSLDTIRRAEAGELVKTKMAQNLLQDKVFNYLVMECIQQLKDLCKDDWPNFEAFYNSIDATKDVTDITTYGLCMGEEKCDNDESDDDDDNDVDAGGDKEGDEYYENEQKQE